MAPERGPPQVSHGIRHVDRPGTIPAHPPHQFPILSGCLECFTEQIAVTLEQTIEHGPGKHDIPAVADPPSGIQKNAIRHRTPATDRIEQGIGFLKRPARHLGSMCIERLDQSFEPIVRRNGIIVDEGDQIALCLPNPCITPP